MASHLRHRPFASMLADLNQEDHLLRPWYDKVPAEQPVLHVLWSRELVQQIAKYAVEALRAAAHAGKASRDAVSPFRILCVGSGASRLRHYLHFILHKVTTQNSCKGAKKSQPWFPSVCQTPRPSDLSRRGGHRCLQQRSSFCLRRPAMCCPRPWRSTLPSWWSAPACRPKLIGPETSAEPAVCWNTCSLGLLIPTGVVA